MELLRPDRRQRLTEFINTLSIYERRAVLEVLQQQSFERDIVSSVPVELAELIFAHLDFTYIFTCRRVCRAWYSILKRRALERTVITEQCYVPLGSSAFVERAAQVQRFRTGKPVSVHQWEMPHGIYGEASADVAFNASRFAVAIENHDEDVTAVEVWDFESGHKSLISSPGLQHIYEWTLSETTLFFSTFTGFLYAKPLDSIESSPLESVRLSSLSSHLWSRGAVVAWQSSAGIGVWNSLTNKMTDIPVNHPSGRFGIDALLIAESGDKISALYFRQYSPSDPALLNIQTYSVAPTSSLVGQLDAELPSKQVWYTHFYPDEISFSPGHPCSGRQGILSAVSFPGGPGCRRLIVCFDQERNTLHYQNYELEHFVSGARLDEPLNKEFLFWNDVVYSVRFDSRCDYDRARSRPALIIETYDQDFGLQPDPSRIPNPPYTRTKASTSHKVVQNAQLCRIRKPSARDADVLFDDVFISGNESYVLVHQKRDGGHDLMTLLSFGQPAKLPPQTKMQSQWQR